jgi:hypothetical protein
MMDSINLETPEFMITVHRSGQVTAVVTAESGWEPENITNTALGKLLAGYYTHMFEDQR